MDSPSSGGAYYYEEEFLSPEHVLDMINGDIPDEEEPPLVVYISRRLILNEVSEQTGLAHNYQEEEFLSPEHVLDMINGDIPDEEEPPLVVYISRRLILNEVSEQTGLAHKYGSVTGEDGLVKACVVMDVPPMPGRPLEKTRTFYGEPKDDLDSALESAAQVALDHLVDEYGVIIDDCNYSDYVEAKEEVEALQLLIGDQHQLDVPAQEVKNVCL